MENVKARHTMLRGGTGAPSYKDCSPVISFPRAAVACLVTVLFG